MRFPTLNQALAASGVILYHGRRPYEHMLASASIETKGNSAMPRTQIQITPADIEACCGYIRSDRAAYALRRPLPTTPGRRQQAILAAGRDAIAYILIDALKLVPNYQALTKAIRRGHQGAATNFNAINRRGAEALGIWEEL